MKTRTLIYIVLITLLLSACTSSQDAAQAPDTSPDQVVNSFYTWYLDRSQPEPKDLHDSQHLTTGLIERYDEGLKSGSPGGGISLVCAQDFPEKVTVDSTSIENNSATVTAKTSFGRTLELTLKIEGNAWKIDAVQCQ